MSHARQVIAALLALTGGAAELVSADEREWRSATFTGSRHTVALDFFGAGQVDMGLAMLERIEQIDLPITGAVVADISTLWSEVRAMPEPGLRCAIELLLVDNS